MTIPLLGGASPLGPDMLLGTVTSASTTACSVAIDGATTAVPVIVPQQLKALLLATTAVNARVACVQVGGRLYVTDVLSGATTSILQFVAAIVGPFLLIPPTVLATFTVPAGLLTGLVTSTGYTTTASHVQHTVLLDYPTPGTNLGSCQLLQSFPSNQHVATGPLVFQTVLTAGTHSLVIFNNQGTSDVGDRATFTGWFQPS